MNRFLFTLPVAALMCGAAFAQTTDTATTTTGDAAAMDGMYGTEWSQTVGATFYSDAEMTTMRTPEEISTSWTTMTQEDRDSVLAECARYRTDSGTTAAMGAAADTTTATGTDTTATTGTDTTAAAGDMAAASKMGTTAANMQMLCDMVETY